MTEQSSAELKRKINRLTEIGRLDEAQTALAALIEQDGESSFTCNKLGVICARLGDLSAAKAYFESALTLEPRMASAHSNLGNIYREFKDIDQAIACYHRALECDSEYATAYHNLGVVYRQKGDFQKAVEHLKQGTKLQKVMARRELSESRFDSKRPRLWIALIAAAIILFYLIRR